MTTTPPGWYPDPRNAAIEHWWDGAAYTQTRTAGSAAPPVPYAPPSAGPSGAVSPKSRAVAAILGFFFGILGVDRFYLGNIGLGVAKLLLGWATFGVWPLVDWIVILVGAAHDGRGLPVTNWG